MPTTPGPSARPPGEATTGRRFILQRTLGEGTFGSVYLAEMEGQGGFRRKVALKLLNANWEAGSDAGRRLRDEARLLGRLQHRHIVRVDDLVRVEGQWALVMEYIDGADLEVVYTLAKARSQELPPRAVAEIGAAVASALGAAWSAPGDDGQPLRVIHRDIKPSNIRLSETGDVKVLDFGVARADFQGREARTERVRYGSLGYMSPERLLGEPDTPAGDVYALGVVVYELLSLDTFGRCELAPDKQAAQVEKACAALTGLLGAGGTDLVEVVRRCLSYRPEERPEVGSVEAVLRAAARVLPGDDVHGYARTGLTELGMASPGSADAAAGRVLDEVNTSITADAPRPFTTTDGQSLPLASGTLVLPADTPEPVEPPARKASPAVLMGGVAALLGACGVAWALWGGPSAPPVAEPLLPPAAPLVAPVEPPPPAPAETLPVPAPAVVAPPTGSEVAAAEPPPASGAPRPRATTAAPSAVSPSTTPASAPEAGTPAAAPEAASSASGSTTRLRAVKFTLTGAEGISARCGDVSGSGGSSALLRDVPAGTCTVTAAGRTASVVLDTPRGVSCVLEGDTLSCQ